MAVQPLFLLDMEALRERLRLDGIPVDGGAHPLLESATRMIRFRFVNRLGLTRVNQIVAFSREQNATSTNGVLRTLAEELEAKWVWVELTRTLPIKFFDNSGNDLETYNEDGTFRSIDPDRIAEERQRCLEEIEAMLPVLAGDVELGASSSSKVHLQKDMKGGRPFPLGSLVGKNKNLWGNNPNVDETP